MADSWNGARRIGDHDVWFCLEEFAKRKTRRVLCQDDGGNDCKYDK
jgi:hypothetical protein